MKEIGILIQMSQKNFIIEKLLTAYRKYKRRKISNRSKKLRNGEKVMTEDRIVEYHDTFNLTKYDITNRIMLHIFV